MARTTPFHLLGLRIDGDLGPYTIYRNKNNKVVVFPKDFRQEKTSVERQRARDRFRTAQQLWSSLTAAEKTVLEDACRKLSLALTGQNLYISCSLRADPDGYHTVARQAHVEFPTLVITPQIV